MTDEKLIEEMLLESGLGSVRGGRPTPASAARMKVALSVFEKASQPAEFAEQGTEEPEDPDAEFEYRVRNDVSGYLSVPMTLSGARDEAKIDPPHDFIERRRKPDEWTPVEQGDDDADR